MRQPTEDQNEGAVLERQPAMVQAARTAAIANTNSNKEQGKQATLNKLGSALTTAITPYLEEQAKNENEARYQKAYLEPGTKKGREQFLKDNTRTGFTAALFGGQTPEVKGTLAALADATAHELYVEQSQFIESEQGDMSGPEYFKHSKTITKKFMEDNFTESPDAAVAFMRSWHGQSNRLATQHSKLQSVRDQQNARQDFKNGWQSSLSAYKTLVPHDGEAAHVLLSDMYDYSKIKTNMAAPAWTSAVVEETIATINLGDTSTIEAFNASPLKNNLDSKQFTAYKTAISKLDTDNVNRVSNFNDELELSIMAAQTPSQVDRAFETHANNIITLSARNTLTAKHRATISGGDVFRGKLSESYDKTRKAERIENNKYLKIEAENAKAVFDYDISTMQGNEGDTITNRISRSSEYVSSSIEQANNPDLPLDIRNLYIKQATAGQAELESSGVDVETALASKANLIQSQLTLIMEEAASKGTLYVIPPELIGALNSIGSITKDDGTKTLVNNLLVGVSQSMGKEGKAYIDRLNQEEKDDFITGDTDNQIDLVTLQNDPAIDEDLEAEYIVDTITNIQEQRNRNDLTKSGAEELQKQENWWKHKLKTYRDEAAKLAAKKAKATKKIQDNTDMVNSIKKSLEENTSIDSEATPAQHAQAGDEIIEAILRTPENQDEVVVDLFDEAFSNSQGILRMNYKLDNIEHNVKSPKAKAAMNASLRRMTSPLPKDSEEKLIWSEENTQAVEAMQTAYGESGVLWKQLDKEEQAQAIYLIHAIKANTDRASVMSMLSKPLQEGSKERPKDKHWKGVVHNLELEKSNDQLQSDATFLYSYLTPKLGHKAALKHTKKLVQYAHVKSKDLDIKFGAHFPSIPVFKSTDTGKPTGSTDLKSIAAGFSTWIPEVKTFGVINETEIVKKGGGYELLQQLVGNTTHKDGTDIKSLKEIPGLSAEVIGDTVVFLSNYGVATLSIEQLGILATDLDKGKQRHERRRKKAQRKQFKGFHGLRGF